MTTFKDWLNSFVVAALLVYSGSAGAGDEFNFRITPEKIIPGAHLTLEIELTVPENISEDTDPPAFHDDLLNKQTDVVLLDKSMSRRGNKFAWTLVLTAYKAGTHRIPPIEIEWMGRTHSTERKEFETRSARAEEDTAVRDEFGALDLTLAWEEWWWKILIAVALATAVSLLLKKYWPKPKLPQTDSSPSVPEEDPLVWLGRELARLRRELVSNPTRLDLVDDYCNVLRVYYAKATKNPVEAWTPREFRFRMAKDEKATRLASLLYQCDEFRFSPRTPARLSYVDLVKQCLDRTEKELLPWA